MNDIKKDKIIKDLFQRFRQIQETSKKKLTLGYNGSVQVIGKSLYNVSISLMYAKSQRKHRKYLNYDISDIFKENRDELSKLLENDPEKFGEFIDSIRKALFLKIESFDHTKTEIPKGQTRLIF